MLTVLFLTSVRWEVLGFSNSSTPLLLLQEAISHLGGYKLSLLVTFPNWNPFMINLMTEPCFYSSIFAKLFPHVIELTVIHRQEETEERFQCVLRELRRGQCSAETSEFIKSTLKFNSQINLDKAVQLYFTNAAADSHNAESLFNLQYENLFSFLAKDVGDAVGLKCPATKEA